MAKMVLILEEGIVRGAWSDTPGVQIRVIDLTEGWDLPEEIKVASDVLVEDPDALAGYSARRDLYPYEVEEA